MLPSLLTAESLMQRNAEHLPKEQAFLNKLASNWDMGLDLSTG